MGRHFEKSILGRHLSLCRKFSALNYSTISSASKNDVQSPKALICFTSHWMYPICGYSHTHIYVYEYWSNNETSLSTKANAKNTQLLWKIQYFWNPPQVQLSREGNENLPDPTRLNILLKLISDELCWPATIPSQIGSTRLIKIFSIL